MYFGMDVRKVYVPQLLHVWMAKRAQHAGDLRIDFHGARNSFSL